MCFRLAPLGRRSLVVPPKSSWRPPKRHQMTSPTVLVMMFAAVGGLEPPKRQPEKVLRKTKKLALGPEILGRKGRIIDVLLNICFTWFCLR